MTSAKKIKTKTEALEYLEELIEILFESMTVCHHRDIQFLQLSVEQLRKMENSINRSQDFFEMFFKDKTKEEIEGWINKEAEQW